MKNILKNFIEDESGLTAVEYAIAGSLVVGGLVGAFSNLGDASTDSINCLDTAVNAVSGSIANCDGS
ncbi:Flp family type IVb pilin [Thalassotalea nanhaiensis]|uniref:Flp family type IVb pilin n=1 Tax=Thalassotalea nanhaiensis TaxID=3065648 RepID=A0ABY9TG06_9GAMM|nr:Flp family type IVb pilin [Colwelliaceae bacterium SQ345]